MWKKPFGSFFLYLTLERDENVIWEGLDMNTKLHGSFFDVTCRKSALESKHSVSERTITRPQRIISFLMFRLFSDSRQNDNFIFYIQINTNFLSFWSLRDSFQCCRLSLSGRNFIPYWINRQWNKMKWYRGKQRNRRNFKGASRSLQEKSISVPWFFTAKSILSRRPEMGEKFK